MVTDPHNASASSAGFVSCASCRHGILSFLWLTEQDPVMELGFESCTRKTGDFCKRCKREFGKKSGNPPPEKNQFRIGGPSVISRRLGGFLALSITFWLIMSGNGTGIWHFCFNLTISMKIRTNHEAHIFNKAWRYVPSQTAPGSASCGNQAESGSQRNRVEPWMPHTLRALGSRRSVSATAGLHTDGCWSLTEGCRVRWCDKLARLWSLLPASSYDVMDGARPPVYLSAWHGESEFYVQTSERI